MRSNLNFHTGSCWFSNASCEPAPGRVTSNVHGQTQGEFTVSYDTTLLGATSPADADTHFRIASNTKAVTAGVIGMQNGVKSKLLTFC
jgi:CubicO group peptidase (beta-lactamase class C family)